PLRLQRHRPWVPPGHAGRDEPRRRRGRDSGPGARGPGAPLGRSRRQGVRPDRGHPAPRLRLTPQGRGTTAPAPPPERTPAMRADYPADYPLAALAACPSSPAFPDQPPTPRPAIACHALAAYKPP